MALETNELFSSEPVESEIRVEPVTVMPKEFNPGADLLAVGTPVTFEGTTTNKWQVYADGDSVDGFVYPAKIQLHATDEVLGVVLIRGKIHYDDIVIPGGVTEGTLQTELRDNARAKGLDIQGLDQVH